MNREIVTALLRQRVLSPVRMVLLSAAFVFPLLLISFVPGAGLPLLGSSAMSMAFILAAGAIGQDYSSGVLQLLFARPVRRSEYVMSRWMAVGGSAAVAAAAQVALASAILASRGLGPSAREAAAYSGEGVLLAFGVASVLLFFSSLVPSLGDLALYLLTTIAGGILGTLGQTVKSLAPLARAGDEISRFLSPQIDLAPILSGAAFSWFAVVSYFSTVTLCLALAIVAVNRRELSYASG